MAEEADDEREEREVFFAWEISPEVRIGVYANAINVWHSPYEFALDWALTEAPEVVDEDDPASPIRIPASVVARLRIPATLVFDVMRALNKTLNRYDAIYGEIKRPFEEDEPDLFGDAA